MMNSRQCFSVVTVAVVTGAQAPMVTASVSVVTGAQAPMVTASVSVVTGAQARGPSREEGEGGGEEREEKRDARHSCCADLPVTR